MKKLFALLFLPALLFCCLSAHAQDVAIGVRGGISIPNLSAGGSTVNPLNTGYSSRLGPDAGVFADFKFSNLFSIQPMIEYSSQGGKKDGFQAFPSPAAAEGGPAYLYATFNSQAKLNYLLVPILAKFGWNFKNSPFRIYVDAGPFAGFLLSAHQVTTGESEVFADAGGTTPASNGPQSFNNTQDIKNQLHTTNFGVEGNVGVSYKVGMGNVFIEGGGNYGFLNIQQGTANGKNNAGAGTVDIGYSYWFGK